MATSTIDPSDALVRTKAVGSGPGSIRFSQGAVDWVRVVSAVMLVMFHASPRSTVYLGAPGLAAFVMLSFVQAGQAAPLMVAFGRRARRILIPWAFWWCFYAMIAVYRRSPIPPIESAWWVIGWPASHLWYLPFLFVNTMAVLIARPAVAGLGAGVRETAALAAGCGAMLMMPEVELTALPESSASWIVCQPGAWLGLAVGSCLRRGRARALAAIVAVVSACSLYLFVRGSTVEAAGYGFGILLVAASAALRLPRSRLATRLALLTPGIYLIHPFVFLVMYKLVDSPPLWLVTLTGVLGGAGIAWVLRRYRCTRALA